MSGSMLSLEEALARLLAGAVPVSESEVLPADEALGRVLAEPLASTVAVPPLDNSAMDGYALRVADWSADGWLPVAQRIPAGRVGRPLQAGEASRIFTGAPLPEGADAVVMQEDCELRGERVQVRSAPRRGDHVRRAAQFVHQGPAVGGGEEDLLRPGLAVSPGVLARLVDLEVVVALLDHCDPQPGLDKPGQEALDQGGLAAAAPADDAEGLHDANPPGPDT